MNCNTIPKTLQITKKLVFDKLDLSIINLIIDKEGQDYLASKFELNNLKIIFREAKVTPTKTGLFVTLWKRIINNPIQPFDAFDDFDLVIISTRTSTNFGQFVFSKSILQEKGILSSTNKVGKLGFRIYPSWDKTENKQAHQTQKWQSDYFLTIPFEKSINLEQAKSLYFHKL